MLYDGLEKIHEDYKSSLKELIEFIDDYFLMKNSKDETIRNNAIKNIKFFTNSIIVTMYGDFERTIKLLSEEYLIKRNRIYEDKLELLINISINHAKEALKCIESPNIFRKNKSFADSLKSSLAKTKNTSVSFEFYSDLISNSFMNALSNQIATFAKNSLEIKDFDSKIKKSGSIVEYIQEIYTLNYDEAYSRVSNDNDLFKDLNLVVNSRHEIAHSGNQNNINDIENIRNKYSKLLNAYVYAYEELLRKELLLCCVENNFKFLVNDKPRENGFEERSILTFDFKGNRLRKNDFVIIKNEHGKCQCNMVVGLMKNNSNVKVVYKDDPTGIRFLKKIKKTDSIFFLSA